MKSIQEVKLTKQNGSALMVSLIILLIMTIVGVQGIRTTTLEEKMAGNYLDNQIAFEAAEHALKEAERWLVVKTTAPVADSSGTNGVWSESARLNPYDKTTWALTNVVTTGTDIGGLSGRSLSAPAQYYIEQRQKLVSPMVGGNTEPPTFFYQVTARGQGGNASSVVLLQSSFSMKF